MTSARKRCTLHRMATTTTTLPSRVGLVGDVHTESTSLQTGLQLLGDLGAELLLCVGDIADGPEAVEGLERCVEMLREYDVLTISGNHDRWLLDDEMRELRDAVEEFELEREAVEYLRGLPPVRTFETPRGSLLLCHGIGNDDMAMLRPHDLDSTLSENGPLQALLSEGKYRLVVHGHTHQRMVRRVEETTFINVGTLHRRNEPCVALLDFEAGTVAFHGLFEDGSSGLLEEVQLPE